jgi:hypothetical protein
MCPAWLVATSVVNACSLAVMRMYLLGTGHACPLPAHASNNSTVQYFRNAAMFLYQWLDFCCGVSFPITVQRLV